MHSVNLGLMGLGTWARDAYLPNLRSLPAANVVAVSARSEESLAFAREHLGEGIATYRDFRELAGDPNVDAVMIALPNRLHYAALEAAVSAGKHVFAEPPLGFDEGEIRRAFELASAADTIVQTNLELRHTPVMGFVAEKVASGELGDALMARLRLWCSWGYGGGEWQAQAEDQGFFLWLGCWYLDALDKAFGAGPLRAGVMGGRAMNGGLLDHGWASLEYPGRRFGQFEYSLVAPEEQQITLRVSGTEGEVEADLWTGRCRWRGRDEHWHEDTIPCAQPAHGFAGVRESIADFLDCVRSGSTPEGNVEVSRRVHAAALACMRSEEQGAMVDVRRL